MSKGPTDIVQNLPGDRKRTFRSYFIFQIQCLKKFFKDERLNPNQFRHGS